MTNVLISKSVAQSVVYLVLLTFWCSIGALPGKTESIVSQLPSQAPSQESLQLPSTESIEQENEPSAETPVQAITPVQVDEAYTLGAGDRIRLDFFNVPEYTGETQVLSDGTVNLPLVGNVSVQGMTVREAADAISVAYSRLLRTPIVTVSLLRPRPLRVSIAGEVNRPGSYSMSLATEADDSAELQWPTVTQIIQTAGGITQQADVGNIQIERVQRSGEQQEIQVNLWELLRQADLSQDITLRDGDNIIIPTATSIQPAEATQLSSASFAPDTIRVSVIGEVVAPGIVEIPPNTPLNQALMVAGGFDRSRARTSEVELIRLNPDGSVTQQTVPIDFAQGINEENNPILRNNDVIVVVRSGSASFSDAVDGVFETLGRIFPIFSLF